MSPEIHREKSFVLSDSVLYKLLPFFVSTFDPTESNLSVTPTGNFLMGTSRSRDELTVEISLASITAARSSSLGIVSLLNGATLVLDTTNLV